MANEEFPEIRIARAAFAAGKSLPPSFRKQQLLNLQRMLDDQDNVKLICDAVYKDLRRNPYDTELIEVLGIRLDLNDILRNFDEYTQDVKYAPKIVTYPDRTWTRKDPHGLVLIFGTWNYPVYIVLRPLVGAIAAGNCVLIKPSEVTSNCEKLLATLIPQYLDNECYQVVTGDAARTQRLLENKFDYIFFTGSGTVAKEILKAAAKHITPCALELGGKSPVYMDETNCTAVAVKRLMWAKTINLGQVCLSPDYLLCTKAVEKKFLELVRAHFEKHFGGFDTLQRQNVFARIVNERHFDRLATVLGNTKGSIVFGGRTDRADLWIEPTIVANVGPDDSLMQDEIFGPILPIVTVESPEDAIRFINSKPRPLAMYVFSKKEEVKQAFLQRTLSGNVCLNDCMFQVADPRAPFGGSGESGTGSYHGKHSVNTFSHHRTVLDRNTLEFVDKFDTFRLPPYKQSKINFYKNLFKYSESILGVSLETEVETETVDMAEPEFALHMIEPWWQRSGGIPINVNIACDRNK